MRRKGMDISIRLVVVMTVLLVLASLVMLIATDYFGVFKTFGINQVINANFTVF